MSKQCCTRHPKACHAIDSPIEAPHLLSNDAHTTAAAAARLRAIAAWPSRDIAVSHTTGGANLAFARNWWRHLKRAGVENFALLATDDTAYAALELELPGRSVRCPESIVGVAAQMIAADMQRSGKRGARYRSAGWTRLMFAVPTMVRWVLDAGLNVLWMDTDVVALSNPFTVVRAQLAAAGAMNAADVRGGGLLLASVDGRVSDENPRECSAQYSRSAQWGHSAGGWKLCGGLFYLPRSDSALAFLREWERRLATPNAGAKNQPHYNEALRAISEEGVDKGGGGSLRVWLLPCELFPNGFRYASVVWRRAQRRSPVAVHNNWIKGLEAKEQRFRAWGMWNASASQRV